MFQAKSLNLVYPEKTPWKNPVDVSWQLQNENLLVEFNVSLGVLYAKDIFVKDQDFPYEFDVVEIFVAVENYKKHHFDYYEFEVTPLGQRFDVKVSVQGEEKFFLYDIDVGAIARVKKTEESWSAQFEIPLKKLGWQSQPEKLYGNFFAILGAPPQRTYWSTFLPQQEKANFHKPEFFKKLFCD